MVEEDSVRTADLIDKAVKIAIECKAAAEGPKLKDFNEYLAANDREDIKELRAEVEAFAGDFHMPGGDFKRLRQTARLSDARGGDKAGSDKERRDETGRSGRCAPWT